MKERKHRSKVFRVACTLRSVRMLKTQHSICTKEASLAEHYILYSENFCQLTPDAHEVLGNTGHANGQEPISLIYSTLMFPNKFCVIGKATQCTHNNGYRGNL
uniref:Uncharacterized protein n=1 Tax=Lactuca sativa TaxID=4236 RepID=A0A9R1WYP4_LACSA|nr:hypothetical protein LSAT_V11C800441250 [Lactuca sativa]